MNNNVKTFKDIKQLTRDGSWEADFHIDFFIDFIDKKCKTQGLDIDPEFQRDHVWTEQQQINFVEFFLQGGKTGRVIYLNYPSFMKNEKKSGYNDFVLVDGKQRLQAIRRFYNNEIMAFGRTCKELFPNDRFMLAQSMKININTLQTYAEVLKWYLDMNSGGTIHTPEELNKVRNLLAKEQK